MRSGRGYCWHLPMHSLLLRKLSDLASLARIPAEKVSFEVAVHALFHDTLCSRFDNLATSSDTTGDLDYQLGRRKRLCSFRGFFATSWQLNMALRVVHACR